MRKPALIALLALLTACGTPQERCIQQGTRELRTIRALRAEVEANLARGYAYETYEVTHTRWEQCDFQPPRDPGQPPRYCLEDETDTFRRRVAIDPQAEARKLAGLKSREAALSRTAAATITACKETYPE